MDENVDNTGNEQDQAPQYTDIELKAMEMGWRPKEEFNGSEDDFIDAKEFVRRAPLFERIEGQSKQIKNITRALDSLKLHYTRVEEAAVNKAITVLKNQRRAALSEGDGDSFELLDDEIKKAETQLAAIEEVKNKPLVEEEVQHPEWTSFTNRNPWYTSTSYMRAFADEHGASLAKSGLSPTEVLKKVEEAVRKEFPHKFTNPNKQSAPDVDSSKGGESRKKLDLDAGLTDIEKKVMNDLVRSGVMTKEKYLADLKAIKNKE